MIDLDLVRELDGRLAVLTFDHGKANEVGTAVLDAVDDLVDQLHRDASIVALITTSRRVSRRGTPIFVAGADVSERQGWTETRVKAHVRRQRAILARLGSAPVFHIAVVGGVALGWGTEYLLACDYAIAADAAVFGLPETGLGIVPGAGGTSELQARIGSCHALRLGMTGERILADEAARIGLVQERVQTIDDGLARARVLAAQVASRSPTALAAFKSALQASRGASLSTRRELEAAAYERCVDAGEAAIGRARFAGQSELPWGPRSSGY